MLLYIEVISRKQFSGRANMLISSNHEKSRRGENLGKIIEVNRT